MKVDPVSSSNTPWGKKMKRLDQQQDVGAQARCGGARRHVTPLSTLFSVTAAPRKNSGCRTPAPCPSPLAPLSQKQTKKEILAQSKKKRRQRCSDQVEISAEEIEVMTDEVIGSGGSFGTVHLADYNGLNAAAKVVVLDADAIEDDDDDDSVSGHYRIEGPQSSRETRLRRWSEEGSLDLTESGRAGAPVSPAARVRRAEQKASLEARRRQIFLREVETMKKLRDANVVRIYGGVVSARDRLVLVMELLPAGSLRHRLKRAKRKLSERTLRRILADVCSGMAFLHAQTFVHGGFKSTNVLFDAGGRAKVKGRPQ